MARHITVAIALAIAACSLGSTAFAQGLAAEAKNVLTPASGGMAGTSLAEPQDVPSAVGGNPATISEFTGTQFTLGGAWAEPTVIVAHDGSATGTAFDAKSTTQGFLIPSIGVTQDLRSRGIPGTFGASLTGLSGLGADFRTVPGSGGSSAEYILLGMTLGGGFDLTDKLSAGASMTLGYGMLDSALLAREGIIEGSTAMVHDYGIRGTAGVDYKLTDKTTVGAYYQTKMGLRFDNLARLEGPENNVQFLDVNLEQPENIGLGFANRSLMHGNLLLACDVYYMMWDDAAFWKALLDDQWGVSVGAQLTQGKCRYRLGYSWASNPMDPNPGVEIGGVTVGQNAIEYLQALQGALFYQHRLTGGVGFRDFLVDGMDLDFFAGGLFRQSQGFGNPVNTEATLAVWYIGTGLTWRYGPQYGTKQR